MAFSVLDIREPIFSVDRNCYRFWPANISLFLSFAGQLPWSRIFQRVVVFILCFIKTNCDFADIFKNVSALPNLADLC